MNKGAKTMIKTSVDRLTPLMFAVRNNNIDIALYLLDVGRYCITNNRWGCLCFSFLDL